MADDGMLINFEIGDRLAPPQAKFKGGRWKDRVRAQRAAHGKPGREDAADHAPAKSDEHSHGPDARPNKRQRIAGATADSQAGSAARQDPRKAASNSTSVGKSKLVASRLFTANPTPITKFDARPATNGDGQDGEEQLDGEELQPSNAPLSPEVANFVALGLSLRLAQHLSSKLNMKAPTAIQKTTIPQLVSADSDAFLQAETGSGKTLAYLLPIVHRLLALSHDRDGSRRGDVHLRRDSGLFAIILAPTRELCKQIMVVLDKLMHCVPWLVGTAVIGGESKKSEKARLRKGVNILVATPGRLTDHLDHTKVLDVGTVRWLVLDEGDRLMEMGFEEDIKTIVNRIRREPLSKKNRDGVELDGILPSRRVTILCSATMKMNVQRLGDISLQDAVHITAPRQVSGATTEAQAGEDVFSAPSQLKQSYLVVPAKLRLVTLVAFLKSVFARRGSVMKAMVFLACADSVDFHFDLLKSTAASSASGGEGEKPSLTASTAAPAAYITSRANPKVILHRLHGSLAQPVRTSTLASFSLAKDPAVLITTDVSSRGLDVPAVDLVIEYDPAFAVADHVHRIGRTARAGRPGRAVLFLQPGCEEGYATLLQSSSPITPQLYDTVLQKGLSTAVELPQTPSASAGPGADNRASAAAEAQSYSARAEALQLHFEQRLLARPAVAENVAGAEQGTLTASQAQKAFRGSSRAGANKKSGDNENSLLVAARTAFRSHIRAYATHVRDERGFFDMTQLHLGHVAKSFALREAPGGLGGGVSRRTHKGPAAAAGAAATGGAATGGGRGRRDGTAADGDGESESAAQADAARRMREKMKEAMNAASEFNIG